MIIEYNIELKIKVNLDTGIIGSVMIILTDLRILENKPSHLNMDSYLKSIYLQVYPKMSLKIK